MKNSRKMLESQTVFISGAGNGHGREYARGVVRAGGTVVANDIDTIQLESLRAELGKRCLILAGDIGDADKLIPQAAEMAGSLDAVINNAATSGAAEIADMSIEHFERITRTNLRGCFLACQAALRHWKSRQHPGRIVNIASRTGLWPSRGFGGYAMSKAGIVALTLAIAEEVDGNGVVANVVCPRAWSRRRVRPEHPSEEEIANLDPAHLVAPVLYLCSAQAGWLNGQVISADGDRLQWMHGWTSASGIRKGESWQPEDMHEAYRRLTGVMTQMSDEGAKTFLEVSGIAARGRPDWR